MPQIHVAMMTQDVVQPCARRRSIRDG